MDINKNNFSSTYPISSQRLLNNRSTNVNHDSPGNSSFSQILEKTTDNTDTTLVFSKHANERLASRNIDLTASQLQRLQDGARLAESKGIKESLVMLDDMAFIVNVKSNTVITAVNDNKEKIFTNIDGAVII